MRDPGSGAGPGTGHRAESAELMLKRRFLAVTGAAFLALSARRLETLSLESPSCGPSESFRVESVLVESGLVSLAATGGLARSIRIGRGTQSGGWVSQSCTVLSAAITAAPAWAFPLPQPITA